MSTHDLVAAGEYWSIRPLKAYSTAPQRLLQVDQFGEGYSWLVDDADFQQRRFSVFITADTYPRLLPRPIAVTRCGRYRIDQLAAPFAIPRIVHEHPAHTASS